ncbi:aspartate/glutamate racemase family protein (plasmid) [Methylobacterium radiotolerans]|jgi:aspartate racemase
MLGILGGMGPLATVEFMRKLILRSSDAGESGCMPMLAVVDGRIPDRSSAIVGPGTCPSPLPDMLRCLRLIESPQIEAVVIPCNSAHYWISDLQSATQKPIISMISAVADHLSGLLRHQAPPRSYGVLGTRGLLASGLYQEHLARLIRAECDPVTEYGQSLVDKIIVEVKHGRISQARATAECLVSVIDQARANIWILGCTELPVAFERIEVPDHLSLVDSTDILVDAAIVALRSRLTFVTNAI